MQDVKWGRSEKESKPCDMSYRGWKCVTRGEDILRIQSHTALKAFSGKKNLGAAFGEHQDVKSVIRSYRKSGFC